MEDVSDFGNALLNLTILLQLFSIQNTLCEIRDSIRS